MDGTGIALALGLLLFGPALLVWLVILPAMGLGLWSTRRNRTLLGRGVGATFVLVGLGVAAAIVLRPELDDLSSYWRISKAEAHRIQLPQPVPRALFIETDLDFQSDWRDIVSEIAESGAFDTVATRSRSGEQHVEFIASDECVHLRRNTPKYVAAEGFARCAELVPGAGRPATHLLLDIGAPGPELMQAGVEATLRLSLVDRGATSLIGYGEARARLRRGFVHRVFMLSSVRESWNPSAHLCNVRRVEHRIDLLGFLLQAIGQPQLIAGKNPTLSPAELLARAEAILASHDPPDAVAAGWAIYAVLAPRTRESVKLRYRLEEYINAHFKELYQTRLPTASLQLRQCREHGVEL